MIDKCIILLQIERICLSLFVSHLESRKKICSYIIVGTLSAQLKSMRFHTIVLCTEKGVTMSHRACMDEQAGATLEADLIVPSQFFDRIKPEHSAQPEKRLMLAVMEDAIATFQKSVAGETRRQRRLLKETEEWFNSRDTEWAFSFENICSALEIEPEYLRGGLRRWKSILLAQRYETTAVHSPFRRISGRRHTLSAGRSSHSRRNAA